MDPRDKIKYGPDRSKSSPKIGTNPSSSFTKVKPPEHYKLPSIYSKNCIIS